MGFTNFFLPRKVVTNLKKVTKLWVGVPKVLRAVVCVRLGKDGLNFYLIFRSDVPVFDSRCCTSTNDHGSTSNFFENKKKKRLN